MKDDQIIARGMMVAAIIILLALILLGRCTPIPSEPRPESQADPAHEYRDPMPAPR